MNNIKSAFERGKAFIPFVTCGDPGMETTEKIVIEMVKNGADLIELGIPFSDPTAEGPVIMEASSRALNAGATTDRIFDMVKRLRTVHHIDIPMVFMTYANVLFSKGLEDFVERSHEVGINGFILPDVPFEEKEDFEKACDKNGMALISMIAPTSEGRIRMIAKEAKGFLYCVSSLGVTGTRTDISTDIQKLTDAAKSVTDIPVAVGFGISTPEQASHMAKYADGVIVGSAIMKIVAAEKENAPNAVGEYVRKMKEALG